MSSNGSQQIVSRGLPLTVILATYNRAVDGGVGDNDALSKPDTVNVVVVLKRSLRSLKEDTSGELTRNCLVDGTG